MTLSPPWHECQPACTAGWQPSRKCHCASCGHNFSTVANFDKHRKLGTCLTPEIARLIQNKRGVWTSPGETDVYERFNPSSSVPGVS